MARAYLLALATLVGLLAVTAAQADSRVALVIGNGRYQHVPFLPNPTNDATDVTEALKRLGFTVRTVTNVGIDDMRRAMREFGRQAQDADMAVVFFAGHGMEIDGENWLIPVDAELRRDTDAENEAISLRNVNLQVASARKLGLVILDACRNNPFDAKMERASRKRAVGRGFVRIEPADNVLVAYAAKDGTTANDGNGRNSPFTAALLRHIETPGLEILFMFRTVRDDVLASTKREQQPFVYGSLSKEAIYLKDSPGSALPSAQSQPAVPAVAEGFRVCNNSRGRIGVAVGHKETEGWVTEGWWNISSGSCENVIGSSLKARYFYVYAIDHDRGSEIRGRHYLCTKSNGFTTISHQGGKCQRGFERTGFVEVDTGAERTWTLQLTEKDFQTAPSTKR